MVSSMITADEVRELIVQRLRGATQKDWAESHDMSPTYLSDVLVGRREPGDKILTALKLERVITYRKRGK